MDIVSTDNLRVIEIELKCMIPNEASFFDKYKASWKLFFQFLKMEGYLMRQMIPRPDIKGMAVRNYNKVTLFNRSVYLFTMAFLNQEINNKKRQISKTFSVFYNIFSRIFSIFSRLKPQQELKPIPRPRQYSRADNYDSRLARATSDDVFEMFDDENDSLLDSMSERESAISSNRVAVLEMEIDTLKKQLAAVLNAVSATNPGIQQVASNATSASTLMPQRSYSNETDVSIPSTIASVKKCPPPPPPPIPVELFKKSKSEKLLVKKEPCSTPKGDGDNPKQVNMCDVLKELNSVKLRSVSKSTESLNSIPRNEYDFINKALKQKFKNAINETLDTSSEWGDEN